MDLPPELLYRVSRYLTPNDILRLAYTCKANYLLLLPQVYSCIKVDSTRQPYNSAGDESLGITTVKSLHSFTHLLKNLRSSSRHCSYVRHLGFMDDIPDLPELELIEYLLVIFPLLSNLELLKWYSVQVYLPCDIVATLPTLTTMKTLVGNFKQFEEVQTFAECSNRLQCTELLVSGFGTVKNLSKLGLSRFSSLKSMTLSRHSLSRVIGETPTIISNFIEPQEVNEDENCIFEICSAPLPTNLTELVLKDICLCPGNGKLMAKSINLEKIRTLKLINCTEIIDGPSQFLDHLHSHMLLLENLTLSVSNEMGSQSSTIEFIANLHQKLRKLELRLQWSPLYRAAELSVAVNAITTHREHLKYLDFDFECYRNKDGTHMYVGQLQQLSQLQKLSFLRVPVNRDDIPRLVPVISKLQLLQFLQLAFKDFKTPIITNNTLISHEYFDFPNSVTLNYHNAIVDQLGDYCRQFKRYLSILRYIVFEAAETYYFNCRQVEQERGLELTFREMVHDRIQEHGN